MTDVVVVGAAEAAEWDRAAQSAYGIPSRVLMESAGRSCAAVIAGEFSSLLHQGVVVVVGPGNNGGDGWVAARALAAQGLAVTVISAGDPKTPDCIANRDLALRCGVVEETDFAAVGQAGVLVDALLGTGATGELRGRIGELAAAMSHHGAPIVAVDGPTGVDLTTGERHGDLSAAVTVTFGGLRRGHLLQRAVCGKVVVTDIGFPPAPADWPVFVSDDWVRRHLPGFSAAMHKGDRGRVLVIGGAEGMTGAALHAVQSAFAAGAGLVKLAAGAETIVAARARLPDTMTLVVDFEEPLSAGLEEELAWADAVVLGPGLGRSAGRGRFVAAVVERSGGPLIIDADALSGDLSGVSSKGTAVVLTPHPGEFRTMYPDLDPARSGPFAAAGEAAERHGCTVLLKGVPTVVASRGEVLVVGSGNPALATGGSGDVLSGVIGAFLARGLTPVRAAALAAHSMGRAAETASAQHTIRATRPEHVIGALPGYWELLKTADGVRPPVVLELEPPATA